MKTVVLYLITCYQKYISPLKKQSCRFHPTCSEYAKTAYKQKSFLIATYLTTRRILRCHPFSDGGVDYVE